jgi:hypothetical protein
LKMLRTGDKERCHSWALSPKLRVMGRTTEPGEDWGPRMLVANHFPPVPGCVVARNTLANRRWRTRQSPLLGSLRPCSRLDLMARDSRQINGISLSCASVPFPHFGLGRVRHAPWLGRAGAEAGKAAEASSSSDLWHLPKPQSSTSVLRNPPAERKGA